MQTLKEVYAKGSLLNDIVGFSIQNDRFSDMRGEIPASQIKSTRISAISSSLRIEGARIKDYELERLINGMSLPSFSEKERDETLGYIRTYDAIERDFEKIPISEKSILFLHSMMMGRETSYRKGDKPKQNILKSEPEVENERADLVEVSLRSIIDDFDRNESRENAVLLALSFTEAFLSINPFEEGNGRLSRLIFRLIFLRGGYKIIRAIPFERKMEEERKQYLSALRRSQDRRDLEPFASYFMRALISSGERVFLSADKSESISSGELSPIEREIIKIIQEERSIYTSKIVETLSNYPAPTVKKTLGKLVLDGKIEMHGKGRGTFYSL